MDAALESKRCLDRMVDGVEAELLEMNPSVYGIDIQGA